MAPFPKDPWPLLSASVSTSRTSAAPVFSTESPVSTKYTIQNHCNFLSPNEQDERFLEHIRAHCNIMSTESKFPEANKLLLACRDLAVIDPPNWTVFENLCEQCGRSIEKPIVEEVRQDEKMVNNIANMVLETIPRI